ncbi:MAG TPA: deoxyribodipyrimidine photo-lyase [Bacteroidales bacterium]|nr:deoxyribodipyrimidine photo-lyase [Bacteroidales bacterium]
MKIKKEQMTGSDYILTNNYRDELNKLETNDISIFWMRRDLRLIDNTALSQALKSGNETIILFIFDNDILSNLKKDDARVSFIYDSLNSINKSLSGYNSSLLVLKGDCMKCWKEIITELNIKSVYCNRDYEPYARQRDSEVEELLKSVGIEFHSYKDQVIFEKDEVVKNDSLPYTIFTPYSKKWMSRLQQNGIPEEQNSADLLKHLAKVNFPMPDIRETGFKKSTLKPFKFRPENINDYDKHRDIPSMDATSFAGTYLRFGIISIRQLVKTAWMVNKVYLDELIWREFFMQILYHFPHVNGNSFRLKYDNIQWTNDTELFDRWCAGKTGYPIVDAGMRQLNETGYMHNRVRMITASFLCKHLLTDWRWGERYFAEKLFDFELSSNNGNWQWAAGSGCDAAPYFRVFNPWQQAKKFDSESEYIKKWIPEYGTPDYPEPLIDHKYARNRAIETYKHYIKTE